VSLFFALWPPRETARALAAWAEEVRRDAGGRATAEPNIHLTLAFLGKADPAQASAAAERVSVAPFALDIDTAKYWKHNKIVWVGPSTLPGKLSQLVERLHAALKDAGFVLEERPFAAHVTLLRKAAAPRSLPPLPPLSWPATEFTLVRSTSTGTGSRYDVLTRYNLKAGG
jgi:2'-5' RNA ligase